MSTRKKTTTTLPASPSPAAPVLPLAVVSGLSDTEGHIYRTVFESVMNQRATPGTKLPEQALSDLFGVHRAVVRKVLQRLAHDGIVELRPNRGAVVAVPTPRETQQIFEARRLLEAAIVPLVAERITKAELQALRRQLREEHAALHKPDQPAWARLASSFHMRLAEIAGNEMLHRYLHELISRCSLIVALYEPPGNAACEHEEHERIVDCVARGDAEGAVQLMDEHLRALERNVSVQRAAPDRTLSHLLGMA